jgi:hypothetical protein
MVDDTVFKSLIMGYQSLKYNFILKKYAKNCIWAIRMKPLDKPIKPQTRTHENRYYFLAGLGLMFRLCGLD